MLNLNPGSLLLDAKLTSNITPSRTQFLIVSYVDSDTGVNKLKVLNNPLLLTGIIFGNDLKFQNSFHESELKTLPHIGLYIPNSVVKLIKSYTLKTYGVLSVEEFITKLFRNFFQWFVDNANEQKYPLVIPYLNSNYLKVIENFTKVYDKLLKFETFVESNDKLKTLAEAILKALVITELVLTALDSANVNVFKNKDTYKQLLIKLIKKAIKRYNNELYQRFIANTERINRYWFREITEYIVNNYLLPYYSTKVRSLNFNIDFDADTGKISISNHVLISTPAENSLALESLRNNLNKAYNNLRIGYLDIEVYSELGFPNEFEANYPVISISLVVYNKLTGNWKVYSLVNLEPLLNDKPEVMDTYVSKLETIKAQFLDLPEYETLFKTFANEFDRAKFEGFEYIITATERDLFKKLIDILKVEKVNLITGWNVVNFDFIYLYTRAKNNRWYFFENFFTGNNPVAKTYLQTLYDKAKAESIAESDNSEESQIDSFLVRNESNSAKRTYTAQMKVFVPYIPWIDYKQLFESSPLNTKSYPSYTLDYIVKATLKISEGKIKIGNITKAYKDNPDLFLKYNILDSLLVYILDRKIAFIDLIFEIRNFTGFFPMWNLNINKILTSYMLTVEDGKWFVIDNEYAGKLGSSFWELVYLNVNMYDKASIDEFRKYF